MESGIFSDPIPTAGSARAMRAWKELSMREGPKKKPFSVPARNFVGFRVVRRAIILMIGA